MTDIVLTTWDRPDFTERVIDAIHDNTSSPFRLIVIDNGSRDETKYLLKRFHDMDMIDVLVLLDRNRGLEYTRHLGLELVETERFVATDSDCLPRKPLQAVGKKSDGEVGVVTEIDWLTLLNSLMTANPDYAALACRTQIMIGSGDIFGEAPPPIVDFTCGGSLRLMQTDIIRKLGGWDRHSDLRGNEEHYICNKIREAGFKCGFASYIPCYHLFGEGNWGYHEGLTPEETGHRPISGLPQDDPEELKKYE